MKKVLFFAAAAIAMLASCSQSDDLTAPTVAQDQQQEAVQFGTYLGRLAQTRAGSTGAIDPQTGTYRTAEYTLDEKGGFGVFAYYTRTADYAGNTSQAPDFMYNQWIDGTPDTKDGSNLANATGIASWSYTPIKYWPNDYAAGAVDTQDPAAQGTGTYGRVSFFAYAPYIATPSSGNPDANLTGKNNASTVDIDKTKVQKTSDATGITAMTTNDFTGHPYLQYKLASQTDFTSNVDLLWGTSGTNGNKATGGAQSGTTLDGGLAAVNVNLTKMNTTGKVAFNFKHALSQVGGMKNSDDVNGLTIKIDPDEPISNATIGSTANLPTTKVIVDNIVITNDWNGTDGIQDAEHISQGGVLNLATGQWNLDAATAPTKFTQTIDGTGTTDATYYKLNSAISTADVDVSTTALTTSFFETGKTGVTTTPQAVYDATDAAGPLVFMPGTTPKLKFTITYRVLTYDTSLASYRTDVTQTISRVVEFGAPVEMNKRYNINIILGLTSVKFTATVSGWDNTSDLDGDGVDENSDNVNLPLNVTGA